MTCSRVRRLVSRVESRAARILAKSNTHRAEAVGPSLSSGLEVWQGEGQVKMDSMLSSTIQAIAPVHDGVP